MNCTATTSHYRNSRDKTQRRTDEEQELTSAMSTDLAICSTDRRSRPAEEERERGVYGGREGGGYMLWRRSGDEGEEETTSRVGRPEPGWRRSDGRD